MLKKILIIMITGVLACSICCYADDAASGMEMQGKAAAAAEEISDGMTEIVWMLIPNGDAANEPAAELHIRNEDGVVSFIRLSDGESISARREFMTLFEDTGAPVQLMRFTDFSVSDGFTDNPAAIETSVYADYQYIYAYVQGVQVMALREIGNGSSAFSYYAFGFDNLATEDFWVFEEKADVSSASGMKAEEKVDEAKTNPSSILSAKGNKREAEDPSEVLSIPDPEVNADKTEAYNEIKETEETPGGFPGLKKKGNEDTSEDSSIPEVNENNNEAEDVLNPEIKANNENAGIFPGLKKKDDKDSSDPEMNEDLNEANMEEPSAYEIRNTDSAKDLTEEQYAGMRLKNETFYAYYWKDVDGGCLLQPMEAVITYSEDWFGTPTDTMRVTYPVNNHPWTAVRYYYADTMGPEYIEAEPSVYRPALVTAITDEEGKLVGILSISYLGYGTYRFPDTISGK